jgi:hypothetical protein
VVERLFMLVGVEETLDFVASADELDPGGRAAARRAGSAATS